MSKSRRHLISIVDDDETDRASTMDLLSSMGFLAKTFARADEFLRSEDLHSTACLIADMGMPGMSGLELHSRLVEAGNAIRPSSSPHSPMTETARGRGSLG